MDNLQQTYQTNRKKGQPGKESKTIIYYYHIPKCGGSYVNELLKKYSKLLHGRYKNFTSLKDEDIEHNRQQFTLFLDELLSYPEKFVFIHHHHRYPGIHDLFPTLKKIKKKTEKMGGRFFLFTVVREPLSFNISRINHLINYSNYVDLTYRDICEDKKSHNMMYKYFLYNHFSIWYTSYDCLDLSEANFLKKLQLLDGLFVQDNLEELVSFLNAYLRTENVSFPDKINVGKHNLLPTKEEEQILLTVNNLDTYFYDLAMKKSWKKSDYDIWRVLRLFHKIK
jgi:hypothetical protein